MAAAEHVHERGLDTVCQVVSSHDYACVGCLRMIDELLFSSFSKAIFVFGIIMILYNRQIEALGSCLDELLFLVVGRSSMMIGMQEMDVVRFECSLFD